MKLVATRSFSNGLDLSKSKLDGPRNKRQYVRNEHLVGDEFDAKEEDYKEALHFGWVVPANSEEAKAAKTKAAKQKEKEAAKQAAQTVTAK